MSTMIICFTGPYLYFLSITSKGKKYGAAEITLANLMEKYLVFLNFYL